jgi:exodeoxyribonuclease (lambda-induced)
MERVQGHDQWKERRRGKITASRLHDIVAVKRNGEPTAAYEKYLEQLALERMTGTVEPTYQSGPMADGTRKEPIARTLYSLLSGYDVEEIEFIDHPTIANAGASPDGLIRPEKKFIEIKCPTLSTFAAYKNTEKIPDNYLCQIGWLFACIPEMETCDYVVYTDLVAYQDRLIIKTVNRKAKFVAELEKRVREFDERVEQRISDLQSAQ